MKVTFSFLAVTILCAASMFGQSGGSDRQTGSANRMNEAPAADQGFAMKAAQGGMAEVELGNLAKEKASSDAVKQFAQRMVDDHSKANDELKELASKQNINLPANPGAKHEAHKNALSKLSGASFDRAYMKHMVQDHKMDVAEFKKESTSGKNPELKAWAGKTLPTLEEHLKMAQDTNNQVSGKGGKKSAAAK